MTSVIEQHRNGLNQPRTLSASEGSITAIRGSIFYGYTSYRDFSVFSCETHLSWQLSFWRPNSAELWRLQRAKIRISMPLDLPVSWLTSDLPHRMIGATLSLMRNSNREQYCDYCKMRYAHLSRSGQLHPLAKVPAYWKAVSTKPGRVGITRFYCLRCADEIQNWSDGTFFSLKEQLDFEINRAKQEYLDDKLA
jgi:hypothetical protein